MLNDQPMVHTANTTETLRGLEMTENTAVEVSTTAQPTSVQPPMYSTFSGGDREAKINQLKAMSASTPLENVLNQEMNLANFAIEYVEMADSETGELRWTPRISLVTDKGTAYHAMSVGLESSLRRIIAVMGEPKDSNNWPLIVKPVQEKAGKGRVFTLQIIG